MAWRLSLPEQAVRRLDMLPGKPSVLVVGMRSGAVHFYDVLNGSKLGERTFTSVPPIADRADEAWQKFAADLTAPNKALLPLVRLPDCLVYSGVDTRLRLIQISPSELYLEAGGKEVQLTLDEGVRLTAVALDRALGLVVALDRQAKLHVFQQHIRVGVFDIELKADDEYSPAIVLPSGGTSLIATDGRSIVHADPAGRVHKRVGLHFPLSAFACSLDGKMIALGDADANLIRVYNGELQPTHQRYAADLVGEAKRVRSSPSGSALPTMVRALTVNSKGVMAFAIGETLCVTNLTRLSALPKPSESVPPL